MNTSGDVPVGYHRELRDLLVALRYRRGDPSLRSIGKSASISPAHLSAIFKGKSVPSAAVAAAIARALGATNEEVKRASRYAEGAATDRSEAKSRQALGLVRVLRSEANVGQTFTDSVSWLANESETTKRDLAASNRRESFHVASAAVVLPIVAQGHAAPSLFCGRTCEVDAVVRFLNPSVDGPYKSAILTISGMAGVGKTALARYAAGIAVGNRWFLGGAIYTDLRGYDSRQIHTAQLYAPVLRAFGVDGDQIPVTVSEQAAVYHHMLATMAVQGRAVLFVIDNASGPEGIADLLPVHRIHRVVVTSRHTLGEIAGTQVLDLDVLDVDAATAVLDGVLRQRNLEDDRAVLESASARELAVHCGRLPLALHISASLLADEVGMRVADLVSELADADTRLDNLTYGERAVAAAFDLSWRHLGRRDLHAAELFLRLSIHPGTELSTDAVIAIADQPRSTVSRRLRTLRRAHLIESGTAHGRWRMHDLVRLFVHRLADANLNQDMRLAAATRLLHHYLSTAAAADALLRSAHERPGTDLFAGQDEALAWLDLERPNLIAAIGVAADIGHHSTAVDLALALNAFFNWRHHQDDHVAVAHVAVEAASILHDRRMEARALNNLGTALQRVRRFDEAIATHQRAVDSLLEIGDRHETAKALTNLATALQQVQRFEEAFGPYESCLAISREVGDRLLEGMTLINLGLAFTATKKNQDAVVAQRHAIEIFRGIGDRLHLGMALTNLGIALSELGQLADALVAHRQAVEVLQGIGDRYHEAVAWSGCGFALYNAQRFEEAIDAFRQSADAHRDVRSHYNQADSLSSLGRALDAMERYDEAISAYGEAVEIFRSIGAASSEVGSMALLGVALACHGRTEDAIEMLTQCLPVFQQLVIRSGEASAHSILGMLLQEVGRSEEAVGHLSRATDIFVDLGDHEGEGRALRHLGDVLHACGEVLAARRCWERAAELSTQVGAIEDAAALQLLLEETA